MNVHLKDKLTEKKKKRKETKIATEAPKIGQRQIHEELLDFKLLGWPELSQMNGCEHRDWWLLKVLGIKAR